MFIHALVLFALASSSVPSAASSPTDSTKPSADTVTRKRTTFGVAIAPVSEAFRRIGYLEPNEGVMLVQVMPNGAAAAANLIAGDMVLAINGKRVDETTLFATLKEVKKGEPFKVEFLRRNKWNETTAVIDP
jgi:serine protease Do